MKSMFISNFSNIIIQDNYPDRDFNGGIHPFSLFHVYHINHKNHSSKHYFTGRILPYSLSFMSIT